MATTDDLLNAVVSLGDTMRDVRALLTHSGGGGSGGSYGNGGRFGGHRFSAPYPKNPWARRAWHFSEGITQSQFMTGALSRGNFAGALGGGGRLMAAAKAGGPAGMALTVIGATVGALGQFKQALDDSTRATISHYRELSEVSSGMAAVMAERDVRETFREMERGDRLAPIAEQLVKAEQDRADASFELELAWEELKGTFLTGYQEAMAEVLGLITDIAVSLDWITKKAQEPDMSHIGTQANQDLQNYLERHKHHRGRLAPKDH